MGEEFTKVGANTVASCNGFTVEAKSTGGVKYCDDRGEALIRSEWLVEPPTLGIVLYKNDPGNKGFDGMDQAQIDSIFSNVARALEYLDHRPQIWSSPSG